MYIAHIRESDMQMQSVEEHLTDVMRLAEAYGEKLGVLHITGLAGMLHDMGKFTDAFRTYLLEAVQNPHAPPRRGSVDHSTAGGRLLFELFHNRESSKFAGLTAEVVGNAIISHHSYLHDFLSPQWDSPYLQRVRDKELKEYEQAKQRFFEKVMSEAELRVYVDAAAGELEAYLSKTSSETTESKLMFLTKYIFSALLDADRTNTREFEENVTVPLVGDRKELFGQYYLKLMRKLESFHPKGEKEAAIHRLRRRMSEECEAFSEKPSGIYSLSIPTGGGKTLASFRYALKHATTYGKKRIIYVVPFTTIIEQNARELRNIIEDDENLLEHHSSVIDDESDEDEDLDGRITTQQKLKLAKDNWDSPIVMTTLVQFLNVFYAKGSRYARRLHNLSEAVIIFDEVQKVPIRCVSLFNRVLNFLKTYARSSIVLCTATQPALDYVEHRLELNTDGEMIGELERVFDAFKRVEVIDRATDEPFTTDRLADFVQEHLERVRSVLVVLNTKSVVRGLYDRLSGGAVPCYHLSTSMCPAHRSQVLERVRAHLEKDEPVVCVSTQLIEAGVDVSFDCVVRSLAGLDSIAQAAGRCNRHGRNGIQKVYVIDHAEERLDRLPEIQVGKKLSKGILVDLRRDGSQHGGDLLSLAAMERYFKELFHEFRTDLDYPVAKLAPRTMTVLLMEGKGHKDSLFYAYRTNRPKEPLELFLANSYRTAAEHFQVIEDLTDSVLVPYGDGKDIIAALNGGESIEELSRLLHRGQQYSVNLFRQERDRLAQNGGLVYLMDGQVLALKEGAYSEEFGVNADNDGWVDAVMF